MINIAESVEAKWRLKQAETKTGMKYKENLCDNKLTDKNPERTAAKVADLFNTNRKQFVRTIEYIFKSFYMP